MEVLQNEIDKNMDKFELYVLRNILKLPNNFEEMKEEEEMKKKEVSVEDTDELMRSEEDELIHLDQNLNAGFSFISYFFLFFSSSAYRSANFLFVFFSSSFSTQKLKS